MRVRGGRKTERPLKRDLARRGIEKIRAAHDLRHALRGVVDDDRELVRERPIGALHDEVADGLSTSSEREPKRRSSKVKTPEGTRKRKARAGLPGGSPQRHVPG